MGKLLTGGLLVTAVAPTVQLHPLQLLLEILGGLAGMGGLIGAGVALYRARSDKSLNNMQAMSLLFEKQREVNIGLLEQRDVEIARLQQQLEQANGNRHDLELRLERCQRDRTLLRNQLRGLQAALTELQKKGAGEKPPHPRPST